VEKSLIPPMSAPVKREPFAAPAVAESSAPSVTPSNDMWKLQSCFRMCKGINDCFNNCMAS
jgi:hypothetical protein